MESIMRGDLSAELPKQDTNLVRIFLSSTFGDFIEERNKLAQQTFPRLQIYCQSLGLEFQVVDMRWGVRDENISYHQTSDVCIQEIHNCQRLSIGPSFVALIGDRYGYRPFPAQIPQQEFQCFMELGPSNGISVTILSKWYKADKNTLDQVYQLLPITVHFPNYSSKDKVLMAQDREGWWVTFLELQRTFWRLVNIAVTQGHMSRERAHIYLQSVTEDEITHGIFNLNSPDDSCLCYTRKLTNLQTSLSDHLANKYIDISPESPAVCIDEEAQELLHELKFQKIPAALGSKNIQSYTIPWANGGINENIAEHNMYLDQLCTKIFEDIKMLIDRALKARGNSKKSTLHTEVLHHASLVLTKANTFCDRGDNVISRVKEFIADHIHKPLVVYGKSGSGKTSVIAKAAHSLRSWSNDTGIVIVRFFGTSPQSSSLREALVSICEQICHIFDISAPKLHEMDTLGIIQYFRDTLINMVNSLLTETLYIVLDSVDQLSAADGAHSMKWLPLVTPPRVKIIVSMLSEGYKCLNNIQSLLPYTETNYIEVGKMSMRAGQHIMNKWLSDIGRCINEKQQALITEAFVACPQPLFLKLLFGRARTWKSYTDIDTIGVIPRSTHEALDDFYRNLEEYFGKVLVEKALGYLTASREGITELELEHVLSLDNEVLNDVYQYWDPPIRGVVRVPSLLWKRIHHFIADYIVEQLSGGATVMVWYHRQFIESATARYVSESSKMSLHTVLTEFFDGRYSNGVGRSVRLSHRDLDLVDVDRQVPSQPLTFGEGAFNHRKLRELPFHLLHSSQLDTLKATVLCNFQWMYTQLRASGYSKLLQDYIATSKIYKDDEVLTVSETLSLSSTSLQIDPDLLAGQLLGRMLRIQYLTSTLLNLLHTAENWISRHSKTILQPLNNCLISPGGELKASVSGHPQVVLGIKKSSTSPTVVSYSKTSEGSIFQVWSIASLECIEVVSTLRLPGKEVPQENNFVLAGECVAAISTNTYMLWNMNTGVELDHFDFESEETFTCIEATCKGQIIIGTSKGRVFFRSAHQNEDEGTGFVTGEQIVSLNITPDDLTTVAVLPSNKLALIDNTSKQVSEVMSTELPSSVSTTVRHTCENSCGKSLLALGTDGGAIHVINLSTFKASSANAHSKAVKCITHVASSNVLITGSLDKQLKVWDIETLSELRELKGHVDGVWCVDSVPGKSLIVSGSKDDYLKVWDVNSGQCLRTLEGHSSWISSVCVLSSDLVVSGSNDKHLKIWKLGLGTRTFDPSTRHLAQPECIGIRGDTLAASGGPDALKVWDPQSGQCLKTLKSPTTSVLFISDTCLVSGAKNGKIEIRDCNSDFHLLYSEHKHTDKVTKMLALTNRHVLISASMDSSIIIWTEKLEVEAVLEAHFSGVTCIATSHCNNMLASGSSNGSVCLWDLDKQELIRMMQNHSKSINCLAFNQSSTVLVSGSDDRTALVWQISNLTSSRCIQFKDSVKTVSFINEDIFITGVHCGKNQLKSWSAMTGECVREFEGHTHAVMCMVTIEKNYVVTGSRDGTVRVWDSNSGSIFCSFDLQSQVKHITVSKISSVKSYLLASTTKTGPIAFFKLCLE